MNNNLSSFSWDQNNWYYFDGNRFMQWLYWSFKKDNTMHDIFIRQIDHQQLEMLKESNIDNPISAILLSTKEDILLHINQIQTS